MGKYSNAILLGIAILLAFLATVLIMRVLPSSGTRNEGPLATVVVVTKSVPINSLITKDDISTKQVAVTDLSPGAISSPSVIIGKYTLTQWLPGQQVIAGMAGNANNAKFSLKIPTDLRAFTLPDSSLIGVDHLIVAGDNVDVLASYPAKNGSPTPTVKTILQDILVLFVDQHQGPTQTSTPSNTSGAPSGSNNSGDTITLAVTPKEAEELAFTEAVQGSISFTLRNPKTEGAVTVPPQTQVP